MSYLLALDQGTTSSRAALIGPDGKMVALAQKQFGQHFPRPGWVEHDPEEIWESQLAMIHAVLERAGCDRSAVAAVGITNQRETTIVFDRATGAPLHRAIVWQDRRTAQVCEELQAQGHAARVQRQTGLLLDPYFSATKIAWILDHVPGARRRAERGELAFGTVDTWLAYRLSGGALHITDASNAARTLLYDLQRGAFDDELLQLFGVPRALLPTIVPSSGIAGVCAVDPLQGVPLAGLIGDQQAATAGQVCVTAGMAKNTYGTGCFLLWNTGRTPRASQHRLLTTPLWVTGHDSAFALEGSVFIGGALVQWLRDGLGLISSADEIEALARTVPSSDGVHLVPAFVGLGAPHWDARARGTILGLTRGSTRAHLARAALEAIAFQVADLLGAMEQDAGTPLTELRVDGGASRNDLLMQMQADLIQVPVVRPRVTETTTQGAAYMAGLGIGWWQSFRDIAGHWQRERCFEPSIPADEAAARRAGWSSAVAGARGYRAP